MAAELLEELKRDSEAATQRALERFVELADQISRGAKPDKPEILDTLKRSGKTVSDIELAVESISTRRKLRDSMDDLPNARLDLSVLDREIAAAEGEYAQWMEAYGRRAEELRERKKAIDARILVAERASQSLRQSVGPSTRGELDAVSRRHGQSREATHSTRTRIADLNQKVSRTEQQLSRGEIGANEKDRVRAAIDSWRNEVMAMTDRLRELESQENELRLLVLAAEAALTDPLAIL